MRSRRVRMRKVVGRGSSSHDQKRAVEEGKDRTIWADMMDNDSIFTTKT